MSRYVRPSGDAPEYTDALKAQVERLTAELAHMQTMQKVDQRVFEKLRETQDLAEHWAILAEQRRVELGECRELLKRLWIACPTALKCSDFHHSKNERHGYDEECKPMTEYVEAIEAVNAAMEAKP